MFGVHRLDMHHGAVSFFSFYQVCNAYQHAYNLFNSFVNKLTEDKRQYRYFEQVDMAARIALTPFSRVHKMFEEERTIRSAIFNVIHVFA